MAENGHSGIDILTPVLSADEETLPISSPTENIKIDPVEGFGPHISDDFIQQYGEGSVFVTATVDCLTARFVRVLKKAGKVPEDHVAVPYGAPEMREALDQLLARLSAGGLEKPTVPLMQSAIGREAPQAFLALAGSILGTELVATWMGRLESEDYAGANALLANQ